MRMISVLLAILLLSVSLSSVSAVADCGFLLWAEDSWTQSGDKGASSWVNWKLIRTDSSLAQCEANSRTKIKSVAESIRKSGHDDKVEVEGNIVHTEVVRKNFFRFHTTRYLCVPDSIDPRPKDR